MMAKPLEVGADGLIRLSDDPGMGFALDEAVLERTRIG